MLYEQACLALVLGGLSTLNWEDPERRTPTCIHEVRLEDGYPNTKLALVLSRFGEPVRFDWRLWGDDFGDVHVDESNRASPAAVADEVLMQVAEFA